MKLLALMPAVVSAAALSRASLNVDLSSMKATLKGIAETKTSGKYIDQTTADTVQLMLDNINGTLVALLHDDKDCAQGMLDIAFNAVENCLTTRSTAFSVAISSANSSQEYSEGIFHECKNAQIPDGQFMVLLEEHQKDPNDPPTTQTGHDYSQGTSNHNWTRVWNSESDADALGATSHEHHAQSSMRVKCQALDNLVKTFNPATGNNAVAVQTQSWCEVPSNDANGLLFEDLYRTNAQMVGASMQWFSYMDRFEESNAADYKEKRRECHEARHRQQVRVTQCNSLQSDFEEDYCVFANAIDTECHLYNTCWTATKSTYDLDKEAVEDAEILFKNQQLALEHILCYGAQILSDDMVTDLSACDALTCQNCDALDITYTDPHAEEQCSEAVGTYRPCSTNWVAIHYGEYFGSEIPVNECMACGDPVLNDWAPAGGSK